MRFTLELEEAEFKMSENFLEILKKHLILYPESEPRDLVKLIYQSCFGCGHMIKDKASALERIKSEHAEAICDVGASGKEKNDETDDINAVSAKSRSIYSQADGAELDRSFTDRGDTLPKRAIPIGGGYVRVELALLKKDELAALCDIFCASANASCDDVDEADRRTLFRKKIALLLEYTEKKLLPLKFDKALLEDHLFEYYKCCKSGDEGASLSSCLDSERAAERLCCEDGLCYPAVSHSERYRKLYMPHYRVVKQEYFYYFELVKAIRSCIDKYKAPIISIDGRCGSGKSTAARVLSGIFGMQVISADDFFLRKEQRTEKRLCEPGGNLDRERLRDEVLIPLSEGKAQFISYRLYSCQTGTLCSERQIEADLPILVEGSYSQHPELAKYYQLKIFMSCFENVQLERLCAREGKERMDAFKARWIPLEEKYFSHFMVSENSDIVFDANSPLL